MIRARGRWWAYGTGEGGSTLAGLVSDDLVRWQPWTPRVSGAGGHLAGTTHWWAPEVVEWDEIFHLYFSAGVARALPAPDRAEGDWVPVALPADDWQLFQRGRAIHGGTYDWHTCEGPSVVEHEGRFWCLYSGGSWQTEGYGMAAVWADHPLGPWHAAGAGPTVIRTLAGRVVGPGHASVVADLAGTDWLAYHAWDEAMTAAGCASTRCGGRTAVPSATAPAPTSDRSRPGARACLPYA